MSKLPFKSDGCTGVPDFNIRHCCELHDLLYYEGEVSRSKADLLFFQCIVNKGKNKNILKRIKYTILGLYYWAGVRIFGKKYYYNGE